MLAIENQNQLQGVGEMGQKHAFLLGIALSLAACDGDGDPDAGTMEDAGDDDDAGMDMVDAGTDAGDVDAGGDDLVIPETYAFDTRFSEVAAGSSVRHGGQTARHVLIQHLKT